MASPDLDYVAARLHGCRSRMAEGDRLDALCRVHSVAELARALFPGGEIRSIGALQQRLVVELTANWCNLLKFLPETGAALLEWMIARFQVENLKVILRGVAMPRNRGAVEGLLIGLPESKSLVLDMTLLDRARSLEELIQLLPRGIFREALEAGVAQERNQVFFMEAALDSAYFRELLARVDRLAEQDQEVVKPVVVQEVDIFHLMLVVRGKFIYGLQPDLLLPLHVEGAQISKKRFGAMLEDQELAMAATRAENVLDFMPTPLSKVSQRLNPAIYEILAWKRFLRLSNGAFRRDPTGLGAIFGYAGLLRIEVANLITVSEGIRGGLGAENIRSRLIDLEEAHV